MATFSDDFERANGFLGGNWWDSAANYTIAGGYISSSVNRGTYNTSVSDNSFISASTHVLVGQHASRIAGPAIKFSAGSANCYWAAISYSSPTWTFAIYYYNGVSSATLASTTLSPAPPPWCKLYLEWNLGALTATVNDGNTLTVNDNTLAAGIYGGFWQYLDISKVADVFIVSSAATDLTADPDVVGNYGGCTDIELTGVNTAWTPGTPGSPTFTVTRGTISAQTVNSATSATITFCPGDYLGAVTITDPSTGETVGIVVSSDPGTVPPPDTAFAPEDIAYIHRSATAQTSPTILNQDTGVGSIQTGETLPDYLNRLWHYLVGSDYSAPPWSPDNNALPDIYARVWGGEEWQSVSFVDPGTNSIAKSLFALAASFTAFRYPETYTIADIMAGLRGTGDYNHTDIINALATVTCDNTEVLEAIAAAQGDPLATIKAVLDSLFLLGGSENNYTLSSVKGWIEAAQGTNTPTIRDVLNKLGTSGNTIEARIDALSDLIVTENTIQGMLDILLTAITGGAGVTITSATDDIIDAINGIPPGQASSNLWPGIGGVTLGDSVALSDGLVVTGPLNGLLFSITGTPSGAGKYVFGDVDSWQHTGGVIFCTDNGDYERAESFGLERQIVVPRTMDSAASAVIRLNGGWSGTVRPWTRN